MVDYFKPTGAGQMMIRDLGYQVQFHIRSGYSSTWVGSPGFDWSGYVNGVNVGGKIANYSGDGWRHVASYDIPYTQDIKFGIGNSGTSGFGGPTDFWQHIYRAPTTTVPPPPTPPVFVGNSPGHWDFTVAFSSTGDGGTPVLEWQLGIGLTPAAATEFFSTSGTTFVPNRTQNTIYYMWARGRNANGWGGWSTMSQGKTLAGAWVKVNGAWVEAIPMIKVGGVWMDAIPFVKVNGAWESGR